MRPQTLIGLFLISALMSGCGKDSPSTDGGKAPSAPTGLTISLQTASSVTVKWNAVPDADKYDWRLLADGEAFKNGSVSKAWVSIDGLSKGVEYEFSARACKGKAASEWSDGLAIDFGPVPSMALCTDAPLVLEFDAAPVLGSSGSICIYESGGNKVDEISLADVAGLSLRPDGQMIPAAPIGIGSSYNTAMDALGSGGRWRIVHYTPLRIDGKALSVKPHNGTLGFGKDYYLTMDAGVVQGHPGIAAGEWTFSTGAEPSDKSLLKVAPDGSGNFCTIQGAVSYAGNLGKDSQVTISIAEGVYPEMLYLRDKNNLTLRGAGRSKSKIAYANWEAVEGGTGSGAVSKPTFGNAISTSGGRAVILVENCDNLRIEDISLQNTFGELEGQAEVIYFNSGNGSHRLTIEGCELWSFQDTFQCKGYVWVHNSLIAGHCDFIWGGPKACLFENCEIRTLAPGYIVQARIPGASDKGFVFLNCNLSSASGIAEGAASSEGVAAGSVWLARSGGNSSVYDNVSFVNCTMGPAIAPGGWYSNPAPTPSVPTASSGWKEYGSKNPEGGAVTGHNGYGLYLTASQAEAYSSKSAVLGWN